MNGSNLRSPRPFALITAKPTFGQKLNNVYLSEHLLALFGTGAASAYTFGVSRQWPFRRSAIISLSAFSLFSIYTLLFYRSGLKLMGLVDNSDIVGKYQLRLDTKEPIVPPEKK
jgi:hypothetical protein